LSEILDKLTVNQVKKNGLQDEKNTRQHHFYSPLESITENIKFTTQQLRCYAEA